MTTARTLDVARQVPKVLLHDHLDGGMRPATIVELAAGLGHDLPETEPEALGRWFRAGARTGDLARYLETFVHTVGVLQTAPALTRAARECADDLAADGVVYAEIRFGPELHQQRGLALDEIVEAVVAGFQDGPTGIVVGTILTALRDGTHAVETARLAGRWLGRGVVGFDLAGPERGFPAGAHEAAFRAAHEAGVPVTVHAGEGAGVESIANALDAACPARLGHGVRIIDDIDAQAGAARLGPVAERVRAEGVLLELCPTSNVDTGAAPSIAGHPIDRLRQWGFRVSVNTDNRLMSAVAPSEELAGCMEAFGWSLDVVEAIMRDSLSAAFCDEDARQQVMDEVLTPRFAALRRS